MTYPVCNVNFMIPKTEIDYLIYSESIFLKDLMTTATVQKCRIFNLTQRLFAIWTVFTFFKGRALRFLENIQLFTFWTEIRLRITRKI